MTRVDEAILLVQDLCLCTIETQDPESELSLKANRVMAHLSALKRAHLDTRSLELVRQAHENLRALGAHLNLEQMHAREG